MKKYLFLIVLLASAMFYSQDLGRVGMNTTQPAASLDIREKPLGILPAGTPQGLTITNFTTDERSTFKDVKIGTMIFNTSKRCLEIFLGVINGVSTWSCIPDANNQPNVTIAPAGFTGSYVGGVALTSANTTKFTLCNNSFTPVSNIDFSSAVTIENSASGVSVVPGQNNNVSLQSGACATLSYTLTGTPIAGTLIAKFNKLSLVAEQSTQVGYGSATISDKTQYVISLSYLGTTVQGKINNGTNKLTIPIPYTNGNGSYTAVSVTQPTAAGEGGDTNNLTLSIPPGNFAVNGVMNADITVDGDGEYLVKLLSPVNEYTIATFPVNMNGVQYNVILKGTSGIPDRFFGIQTNGALEHQFIYLPIQGPDGKTWLSNNLGADYTNINSPNFSYSGQQATSKTDYKAYGSLYQWQRKSDGHELINWTSSTAGTGGATTTALATNSNWTAPNRNFILSGDFNSSYWSWTSDSVATNGIYNLWIAGGANNPCPSGYHVPNNTEWSALASSVGTSSYFWTNDKVLKLPASGVRSRINGGADLGGTAGFYHSSSPMSGNGNVSSFGFDQSTATIAGAATAWGRPVRCIKD